MLPNRDLLRDERCSTESRLMVRGCGDPALDAEISVYAWAPPLNDVWKLRRIGA
jgi:hypothetical protein